MTTVRPGLSEDDDALRGIDAETWTTATSPAPYQPDRPFFGERTAPEDVLVAVDDDGVVLGYARLHNAIPVPSHADVLEIGGLAVAPAAQGRGVGRALVEAACAELVRRGARKVTLRVLGPNAGARRLYAACGFVEEGLLRGEFVLDGVPVDDVLMAWWPPTG